MAKKPKSDPAQLSIFPLVETNPMEEKIGKTTGGTKDDIAKGLNTRKIKYAIEDFLVEGKLDIALLIQTKQSNKLADAFLKDFKKQKQRKSPYPYKEQLNKFFYIL